MSLKDKDDKSKKYTIIKKLENFALRNLESTFAIADFERKVSTSHFINIAKAIKNNDPTIHPAPEFLFDIFYFNFNIILYFYIFLYILN